VSLQLDPRGPLSAEGEADDAILAHMGQLLRQNARAHDLVARVGDSTFAILGAECERGAAEQFVTRLRAALARAGVGAAIGLGIRDPAADLYLAWELADQAMQADRAAGSGG
jgi:GGDEF domain-containing protein